MQSLQSGGKFRSLVFRSVILAFFVALLANAPLLSALTATQTALATATDPTTSEAYLKATVTSQSGVPTGTVTFYEGDTFFGSAVLDASGIAKLTSIDAATYGPHNVLALYNGSTTYSSSTSTAVAVGSAAPSTQNYTLTASSNTSLSVTAGGAATLSTIKITPQNGFAQFVNFSCSGLPSVTTCTFSPSTLSTSGVTSVVPSVLTLQTTSTSGAQMTPLKNSGLFYAFAFPGVLAVFGFAGARKRFPVLGRTICLTVLLGISLFGMTACAARYNYFHHGPGTNTGTPAGTYTVLITSSSDNGIASTSHTMQIALTVQ